jgi:hypothetical protein
MGVIGKGGEECVQAPGRGSKWWHELTFGSAALGSAALVSAVLGVVSAGASVVSSPGRR